MLKELFESIGKTAVKAEGQRIFTAAAEPKHRYYLSDENGALTAVESGPEPRHHVAGGMEVIVDFAKRFHSPAEGDGMPAIWYSRGGIVCLIDDGTRRDRVDMPLKLSKQMEVLLCLEGKRGGLKQAELIKLLRIEFADALSQAEGLVDLVRRVKFTVGAQTETEVRHTKTSIGRSLEAEITGASAIPENVTLEPRIFASGFPNIRRRIVCALDVDPQIEQFFLTPLAGETENALFDAESVIGDKLEELLGEVEVPVYYGAP
jgi:hypothetical protein